MKGRLAKEGWDAIEENAEVRLAGDVSVGKVSMGLGVVVRMISAREVRLVGFRARRARARLPCLGEARTLLWERGSE